MGDRERAAGRRTSTGTGLGMYLGTCLRATEVTEATEGWNAAWRVGQVAVNGPTLVSHAVLSRCRAHLRLAAAGGAGARARDPRRDHAGDKNEMGEGTAAGGTVTEGAATEGTGEGP